MRHFQELLDELFQRIVLMGSLAESMIRTAVRSLMEQNESLAAEVYAKEQEVNSLQVEVDEKAVRQLLCNEEVIPAMAGGLAGLYAGQLVQATRVMVAVADQEGVVGMVPV